MIVLEFLICIFILYIGYNFRNRFSVLDVYDKLILKRLYFYHLFFGIVYYSYILKFGGDSTNYWFLTYFDNYNYEDVTDLMKNGSATGYMLYLNYIPAKFFGFAYLTGNLIYNLLGYMGFVYFYVILKTRIDNWSFLKTKKVLGLAIFPFFLFLPNLHFWTSGVSKDTLMFFSIAMFAYSLQNIKRNIIGLGIPILLTVFIRPHITLFMVSSFALGFFFDGRLKKSQKLLMIIVFSIGFAYLLTIVQQFANIESLETQSIESYSEKSASNLSAARIGSAVDMSNYPLVVKIFTFLYRPLFFDGLSTLNLISSLENLLVLIFTFVVIKSNPIRGFNKSDFLIKGFLFLLILGSIAFSMILGNLGIMMRQKTPFIAALIIFGFITIDEKSKLKKTKT